MTVEHLTQPQAVAKCMKDQDIDNSTVAQILAKASTMASQPNKDPVEAWLFRRGSGFAAFPHGLLPFFCYNYLDKPKQSTILLQLFLG